MPRADGGAEGGKTQLAGAPSCSAAPISWLRMAITDSSVSDRPCEASQPALQEYARLELRAGLHPVVAVHFKAARPLGQRREQAVMLLAAVAGARITAS